MAAIANLFGDNVMDKEGNKVDLKSKCAGKIVGILIAHHWCPPSKRFTPKLAKFYEAQGEGRNFEIIFVSDVIFEDQFKEYYSEMPWLALSYEKRELEVFSKK